MYWWAAYPQPKATTLLGIDDAVLHYERNLLQRRDVVKRIAGDGAYVSSVASFEGSDFIFPAQQLCTVHSASLDSCER
jgi:hypothetical protein